MKKETIKITRRSAFLTQDQVILPRKLTAENGAKALLSGEFFESVETLCPECAESDENCDCCHGNGMIIESVPVSWTTIKAIYDKIVGNFEVKP
ncbi:hypothetical protein C4588_06055 [Candidatus Parcubacteria bacterium]|nr:MAG: hypothetical protein C4588_06055 [Candidatus Parcubacteria bacterium]